MKLRQLLDIAFAVSDNNNSTLFGKEQLEPLKELLLQTEEFKDCTSLEFVDHPVFYDEKKHVSCQTYKLDEFSKVKGKAKVISIFLTPEVCNPKNMYEPVKDGCVITPVVYDTMTFEPRRRITIEYKVPTPYENILQHSKHLHELLDKVLTHPEEYQSKTDRYVCIRGVFDELHTALDGLKRK